ncbi:MAG: polysaccharide biosynthesis C-terminal domain-containing protein [Thermoproteota archaeon]
MKFGNLKEISSIGSADIIGTGITSLFWFLLASQISPDEFGQLFYLIGIAATAAAFALIGTQSTITVYSSKDFKIESTLYFISLVLGVIASFVIMIIFYRVDIIFLLFGYIINTLAIGELLGKKSFLSYSKHTLIQKLLTLGLGMLFFLIFGMDGIIFALSISYGFFIIVLYKRFKQTEINFNLLKNRTKFIINNYIVEILTKLNSHLNKFIIVPVLGFGILGNFSLAIQIVNVGLIFTMIVFKYTIPYDAQGTENKKLKTITFLISIGIAFLGMIITPTIIPIFFSQYLEAIDVIRIISFSIIPMTATKIFTSKLLGQEKSRQILFSKIASLITFISLIVALGPTYGIIGVAIGYLLSTIIESICLIPKIQVSKS